MKLREQKRALKFIVICTLTTKQTFRLIKIYRKKKFLYNNMLMKNKKRREESNTISVLIT